MLIKTRVSHFLRNIRLLSVAERIRFYRHQLKNKKKNQAFKRSHKDVLLPPDYFIYETYCLDYNDYWYDGKITASEIVDLINNYYAIKYRSGIKILDWGSGSARIVRHFPVLLPESEIHATDYNEKYIGWCVKNLKEIKFELNKINPPLKYQGEKFDIVIGLSVFTHLSKDNHFKWLAELARVLKRNGVLYITTQGKVFYKKLLQHEKELFDNHELVTRENVMEGNRLFSAFQPKLFMHKLIEGKFKILHFAEGTLTGKGEPNQDIWVFQKK